MMSNPSSNDWAVLGGYYGEPAKLVKGVTNDLPIPADAEIVLEGRIITSEGWTHDGGPYGEYTGTYGGGRPHNNRFVVDCITDRKDAICQHATIGGLHPGRTDMFAFMPAIEGDLYNAVYKGGILVQNVYLPRRRLLEHWLLLYQDPLRRECKAGAREYADRLSATALEHSVGRWGSSGRRAGGRQD